MVLSYVFPPSRRQIRYREDINLLSHVPAGLGRCSKFVVSCQFVVACPCRQVQKICCLISYVLSSCPSRQVQQICCLMSNLLFHGPAGRCSGFGTPIYVGRFSYGHLQTHFLFFLCGRRILPGWLTCVMACITQTLWRSTVVRFPFRLGQYVVIFWHLCCS